MRNQFTYNKNFHYVNAWKTKNKDTTAYAYFDFTNDNLNDKSGKDVKAHYSKAYARYKSQGLPLTHTFKKIQTSFDSIWFMKYDLLNNQLEGGFTNLESRNAYGSSGKFYIK